ncbi:MAG: hypothetical protein J2P24_06215 [Streptosporangiales bacterium]|nr:hypothetical protein [Streptosporangiales bacterium]
MDVGDGPREVLERLRRASIDQSERGLADVYRVDAVHEFPFRPPGVPERLEGREEIMSFITAGWRGAVPKYEGYRTVAVHETVDSGRIAHLRDYVDVTAAMVVIAEAESPDASAGEPS